MEKKTYKSLFLGITIALTATACYALISPKSTEFYQVKTSLPLPALSSIESTHTITPPAKIVKIQPELKTLTHTIKSGQSLSSIFSLLELKQSDLHKIIHTNNLGKQFISIIAGKELLASLDSKNQLKSLVYKKSDINSLKATRIDDQFEIEIITNPTETKITTAHTTINSSLFIDGKKNGLSDRVIMELASIFAWDIDFALNLHNGDQFTVVYEKTFVDNKEVDSGNILSAEFINQGQSYTAVRFENEKGIASYFTPEGKSMRKAFLRTPVDFARISSHFNLKRKHPVLNRIRAHKGVDYAARSGTKIKSTGDGKIIFRGRKGGYGRVVIVQHGQKYSSLYAHMSKFKKGQRVGSRVTQGDIIGYVGRSGLASGDHLHYEFRVNGVHRNPVTIKLPHSDPIKNSILAKFKQQTQPLLHKLNKAKPNTLLAQKASKQLI